MIREKEEEEEMKIECNWNKEKKRKDKKKEKKHRSDTSFGFNHKLFINPVDMTSSVLFYWVLSGNETLNLQSSFNSIILYI